MKKLTEILNESFVNVFKEDDKNRYVDTIWSMIQDAYAYIGGIKGSGFTSKQDMIDNIHMWKIAKSNGKVVAVILYKDKNGRKRVAGATDGSQIGKEKFAEMTITDVKANRSYSEMSGAALSFTKKKINIHDYAATFDEVKSVLGDKIIPVDDNDPEVLRHPDLKKYFYQRKLGSSTTYKTKLMLGLPHKTDPIY